MSLIKKDLQQYNMKWDAIKPPPQEAVDHPFKVTTGLVCLSLPLSLSPLSLSPSLPLLAWRQLSRRSRLPLSLAFAQTQKLAKLIKEQNMVLEQNYRAFCSDLSLLKRLDFSLKTHIGR
jgi:hypothetical protein